MNRMGDSNYVFELHLHMYTDFIVGTTSNQRVHWMHRHRDAEAGDDTVVPAAVAIGMEELVCIHRLVDAEYPPMIGVDTQSHVNSTGRPVPLKSDDSGRWLDKPTTTKSINALCAWPLTFPDFCTHPRALRRCGIFSQIPSKHALTPWPECRLHSIMAMSSDDARNRMKRRSARSL